MQTKYEFNDLVQVANLGLIKAVENYDPSNKSQFSTYSLKVMENFIRKFMFRNREIVMIPDYVPFSPIKYYRDYESIEFKIHDYDTLVNIQQKSESQILNCELNRYKLFLNPREYAVLTQRFGIYDEQFDYALVCKNMEHPFFDSENRYKTR